MSAAAPALTVGSARGRWVLLATILGSSLAQLDALLPKGYGCRRVGRLRAKGVPQGLTVYRVEPPG